MKKALGEPGTKVQDVTATLIVNRVYGLDWHIPNTTQAENRQMPETLTHFLGVEIKTQTPQGSSRKLF